MSSGAMKCAWKSNAGGTVVMRDLVVERDRLQVRALTGPAGLNPDHSVRFAVAEASRAREDGVLYRDLDGINGNCLYWSQSQGVILYFAGDQVYQVTLLPKTDPR